MSLVVSRLWTGAMSGIGCNVLENFVHDSVPFLFAPLGRLIVRSDPLVSIGCGIPSGTAPLPSSTFPRIQTMYCTLPL